MTRRYRSQDRFAIGLIAAALLAGQAWSAGQARAQAPVPDTPQPPSSAVPDSPGVSETPAAISPDAPFVETLPQTIDGVPGTWDLSRDGTTRRCVMTLAAQSTDSGRRLSFPAGCRRALPILNGVEGWLFVDGAVRLVDRNVRPLLSFKIRDDRRSLMARTEGGEVFSLVPLQIAAMSPAVAAAPEVSTPAFQVGPDKPAESTTGERPRPGLYTLDRYRDRDVCRLDLVPGEGAAAPLRVLDGCRDSGLTIFDPVSWQAAPGRLTLTARKGHTVNLVPTGENHWRREPEVGTTFVLRRIEPATPAGSP